MSNNEKMTRPPRRFGGRGPGGMSAPGEKANDFKSAMKRLFSELNRFKILIIISLVLAVLSSILSIVAPNKLSDLTDEISEGLTVNTENLERISNTITANLQEAMSKISMQRMQVSNQSETDSNLEENSTRANISKSEFDILSIPEEMKEVLFKKFEIDGVEISADDQYSYL